MGHHQRRESQPLLELLELLRQGCLGGSVKCGERLVQQHERRIPGQGASESHPLLLTP